MSASIAADSREGHADGACGRGEYVRRLLITLLVVALGYALIRLIDLVLLMFAAVLVAIILRAASEALARVTGLPSGWSLCIAILVSITAIVGLALSFGGLMIGQAQALASNLPATWHMLEGRLLEFGVPGTSIDWILRRLRDGGDFSWIAQFAGAAGNYIGGLLLAVVGGIYLAAQPDLYRRGLLGLVKPSAAEPVGVALDAMEYDLRHWVIGQLATMTVVGTLTGIGAFLIGLPSAAALALIAGILEFVPYVGPIATAVPALLLASSVSGNAMLLMLLVLIAVQQLEGYLLTPLIQRRVVSLPPALTLFAVIAMGILLGPLGVLLATPLTVCIRVLVRHAYLPMLGRPLP